MEGRAARPGGIGADLRLSWLDGYGVMDNRSQIPKISSKMDVGTTNGVVAETSSKCAAMSSAVGLVPGCAIQPLLRPTNTRAKRPEQAE